MKLIKSAIVYKASIPSSDLLEAHLKERAFAECMELQLRSIGFVPPNDEGLVQDFPGGFAFRVRIDEKVIPAAAVKAEVQKQILAVRQQTGRKVGKSERAEIKQQVMTDLCSRALVTTKASVTCFYDTSREHLIVATSSKSTSDQCVSLLVDAVGSVKTETINVSEVKHGLTTRLTNWLSGNEDAFADFQPAGNVTLAAQDRKIVIKMLGLESARAGINEAVSRGSQVTSIGMSSRGVEFKLTSDFHFKSVHFVEHELPEEEESLWAADASAQVCKVSMLVEDLCSLLSYKEEA